MNVSRIQHIILLLYFCVVRCILEKVRSHHYRRFVFFKVFVTLTTNIPEIPNILLYCVRVLMNEQRCRYMEKIPLVVP